MQAETMQSVLNKKWENLQLFCDLSKMFVKTLKLLTGVQGREKQNYYL